MIQAKNTLDAISMLVAAFHWRPVSEQTIRVYVAALDDLEPVLLAHACLALIRERQWPSLPQVAEIRAKYAELADPEAMTAEAGWEALQAWGQTGERSESSLPEQVRAACDAVGPNTAWLFTAKDTPVETRSFQRRDFLAHWRDRAERRERVERRESLGLLPGVNLKEIGNGGAA